MEAELTDAGRLSDAEVVALKALERAGEPLTANKLRERLAGPHRLPIETLTAWLERQVAEGRLHRLAPYGSRSPRYSTVTAEAYACQVLQAVLAEGPLTLSRLQTKIASRLADCPAPRRKELLEELVRRGELRRLPPLPGSSSQRYSQRPPDPSEYLAALVKRFVKQVDKQAGQLVAAGVAPQQTARAAWKLIEAALAQRRPESIDQDGNQPAATGQAAASETVPPSAPDVASEATGEAAGAAVGEAASPVASDSQAMILDQLTRLRSDPSHGPLVPVRHLRHVLAARLGDKRQFDAALLELARSGQLALYRHDFPASLDEAERAQLVSDAEGNLYNGVSLRSPSAGTVTGRYES
ncbi:MAG: hypothetical protein J5I93_08115 [Pirellulaceae bacterium]|nr:hypothetical protein [Pirellulaceae bacterium]